MIIAILPSVVNVTDCSVDVMSQMVVEINGNGWRSVVVDILRQSEKTHTGQLLTLSQSAKSKDPDTNRGS